MLKALALTAQLLEIRETSRALLGPDYAQTMKDYGAVVSALAEAKGLGFIEAAHWIVRDSPEMPGRGALYVIAAAVELTDPTPAPKGPRG